tara:strand:+ start:386 stop:799 length:414 start_codon:yes stop_codon:yes gene_type:complete
MILLLYIGLFTPAWNLHMIDSHSANTIIRLWHQLHVTKNIDHDFIELLSPKIQNIYIASVKHNEIKAIASFKTKNDDLTLSNIQIQKIAHAPEELDAGVALLKLLHEKEATPDWNIIKNQHRWYCEELYLNSNNLLT